ncbi:hypothetical protein ACU4GD_12655 [Cupriavidus basilensis]
MENELKLVGGAMVTLSLATSAMIVVPFLQLKDVPAPARRWRLATSEQLRGREVPISPPGRIACPAPSSRSSKHGAGRADEAARLGPPHRWRPTTTTTATSCSAPCAPARDLFQRSWRAPAGTGRLAPRPSLPAARLR